MEPWLKTLITILVVLVLIVVFVGLLVILPPIGRWAWVAFAMLVLLLLSGNFGTVWGAFGALVDPQRGRYSLSQLQLVAWTVLVLSAWVAMVFTRIMAGVPDPLNVDIPKEVLALLGISATSLVSATAIKSNQKKNEILLDAAKAEERDVKPKWTDFWTGDQTGDYSYIDIGKFQMFWFTLAAVVTYATQISTEMAWRMPDPELIAFTTLPKALPSLVGVLGISHLGYLANKIPPREE